MGRLQAKAETKPKVDVSTESQAEAEAKAKVGARGQGYMSCCTEAAQVLRLQQCSLRTAHRM